MTARRHHYVPQCYLKNFAPDSKKPKLFVVDFKTGKQFSTSPENVAHERDFHTVRIEGEPIDAFESALSGFESDLSISLDRIIAAGSISNADDRGNLFNLMALMAAKNPRHREKFRQFEESTLKHAMRLMVGSKEIWDMNTRKMRDAGYYQKVSPLLTYESMKEFVENDRYTIEFAKGHQLGFELRAFDNMLQYFFGRQWWLWRAPKGSSFVTSDHPVCLMWAEPSKRQSYPPPGFGLMGTQILFPVSRDIMICGAFELKEMESYISERFVAAVNAEVMLHAERQVYGRDRDFRYKLRRHQRVMHGFEAPTDPCFARAGKPGKP